MAKSCHLVWPFSELPIAQFHLNLISNESEQYVQERSEKAMTVAVEMEFGFTITMGLGQILQR